jgi:hypothetical protein
MGKLQILGFSAGCGFLSNISHELVNLPKDESTAPVLSLQFELRVPRFVVGHLFVPNRSSWHARRGLEDAPNALNDLRLALTLWLWRLLIGRSAVSRGA